MKKTLSMLLAFSMLLGLLTTMALAAGEESVEKITISVNSNDTHTYDVYQIFTGDLYGNVLSNLVWGKNGTGETGEAVAEDVLNALTAVNGEEKTDTERLAVIKQYVNLTGGAFGTVSNVNELEVAAGYYLLVDKGALVGNESYSLYVVEIVGPTEILPKRGTVEFQKKVDDKNDSNTTEDTVDWQDSADYDIGDSVPFQLKGTVAENYADYETYKFVFHDKQSAGLTFNNDVKVYVDGVLITNPTEGTKYYEVVTEGLTDGCTFEVRFADLKQIEAVKAGSVITVEYTATLNNGAVIGSTGNTNTAKLEFSNNPNNSGEGNNETGTTPDDTVVVFTYKVVVDKVDEQGEALAGAGFTLYKWEMTKEAEGENEAVYNWVAVGSEITGVTTFTWTGLDDGDYKLSETTTPAGYNTIADIEFTITAEHSNTEITKLEGETFTASIPDGSLTSTVVNQTGSVLPETGGIGTTIFYALGGLMAVGAGVLLVAKKRMDA